MKKRFLLTLVLSFAFLSKGFSNDFIPLNVEWVKDEHKYHSLITKQDEICCYYIDQFNHPSNQEQFQYPHAYLYDKDGGLRFITTSMGAISSLINIYELTEDRTLRVYGIPYTIFTETGYMPPLRYQNPFMYFLDEDNVLYGNYSAMGVDNIKTQKSTEINYFKELRQQNIDGIIDVFIILFVEYDNALNRINVVYYAGGYDGTDSEKYVYSDNFGKDWISGTYKENCYPINFFYPQRFHNGKDIWYEAEIEKNSNINQVKLYKYQNCNKSQVFSKTFSSNIPMERYFDSHDVFDKDGSIQFDSKYSHLVWGPLYSNDYGNTLYMIENSPVPEEEISSWLPQVFSDGRIYLAIKKKNGEQEFFIGTHHLVSVEDNNFVAGELSLYPNPTRDILHIRTDDLISRVELSDVLGNVVISDLTPTLSKGEGVSINVENLPAGMYFLKLYTASGEVLVEKVLIGF